MRNVRPPRRWLALCTVVLCVAAHSWTVGAALAAAQGAPAPGPSEPARSATGPSDARVRPGQSSTALHVKFVDGSGIRLRGQRFVSLTGTDVSGLAAVLDAAPGWRADRMVTRSEEEVAADKVRNEARSGRRLADFNLWFEIAVPEAADLEALLGELIALDVTEVAYAEPLPAPNASPSFVTEQGYRTASPDGIGAELVSGIAGASGDRVKVIDIEYSWNVDHEDLDRARAPGALIRNGTPTDPFHSDDHGTAVLGELVGDADAQGVTGLVPGATVGMVNAMNVERGYDLANAIDTARRSMVAGDVMLIEQQTTGPNGDYAPVEYWSAFYDAIRLATSQGIIVVEAAGNGNSNLSGPAYADTIQARPDSGAIVVGAGAAPGCGVPRTRLGFSNHGARVDLQGWGECVATTGYGWLHGGSDKNAFYTAGFSGTSSAAPIVAAAAAAVSSAHERATGGNLTPHEVRARLVSTGTPQDVSVPGKIGPLPDLTRALGLSVPSAPNGFTVTTSDANRTATIGWTPPTSDGGSPITGYRVARSGHGTEAPWSTTVAATARSHTFLYLTAGGTYTLSVEAITANGTGAAASGTVTIGGPPGAPTSFSTSKDVPNRSATITWLPPASIGGAAITGYRVSRSGYGGEAPWSTVVPATARSHTFLTLTTGGTYTLSVEAINALGTGPAASGTVTMSNPK